MSRLLRFFRSSQHVQAEPRTSPGPATPQEEYSQHRHATADFTEGDDDDEEDTNDEGRRRYAREQRADRDEDGLPADVLPLFSATTLDTLPVYNITHSIRVIVQTRTETTLTWDQLRSPQVSQFLVKPMQEQIRAQHFSRATLYALMANCLQFSKEGQQYPGQAGTSSTRAKVCELLAIKLLKEYSTRELIDALSYDFYPLQGIPDSMTPFGLGVTGRTGAVRISTLEVAIRASAKKFLAHPLVVQQLEAIWSGAITFYSAADSLHRRTTTAEPLLSAESRRPSDVRTPLLAGQPGKEDQARNRGFQPGRRTAMLYDPRNASLFKLSRLRVPRYRHILSTCSLAVLVVLFLAVLVRRSKLITPLELVFWFWSAGFMLDELVGFTEQGFSLYIMSFWNIFDLGILLLLIVYYFMRVYGVFLIDANKWNEMAYDVLAANAILLLPRIFSVLDHHPYFSQLLIAFRLMAVDLAAIFILVLISCSGFFVFFTLSRNSHDAGDVAYKIFQILMGFSPAAWELWGSYNWLGQTLMGLFLIVSHFLVVTILISVLSNSFQSIARNASEEHQFLFAINTVSQIKNDALFAYIAPGNIFAWMLMPLRYCMPLRQFVWLNRTIIKATHLPILFCIFVYERYFLASSMYEPTDLVENPGRSRRRGVSLLDPASRAALFSPNLRVREESMAGYQKDRALEEVFRQAPDYATLRSQRRSERRKTQHQIRSWIDQHEGDYPQSPRNYSTVNSRPGHISRRQSMSREQPDRLRHLWDVRSAASDPAELYSNSAYAIPPGRYNDGISRRDYALEANNNTDADGDDELVTNDEDEEDNATDTHRRNRHDQPVEEDYFTTPVAARFGTLASTSHGSSAGPQPRTPMSPRPGPSRRQLMHSRTLSTNTILFAPQDSRQRPRRSSSASMDPFPNPRSRPLSTRNTPVESPGVASGRRSPRRPMYLSSRPRTFQGSTESPRATQSRPLLRALDISSRTDPVRRHSSVDIDTLSELGGAAGDMAMERTPMAMGKTAAAADEDASRLRNLMLSKMRTLEEGMSAMVREMRGLRAGVVPGAGRNSGDERGLGPAVVEVAGREGRKARTRRWGGQSSRAATPQPTDKGKGKAVAVSDTDEDGDVVGKLSGLDGASSFGKGNSL
ncbi:hypothetical protein CONLIGDRAFT_652827 [Coniochaeta ligniaria NRRL 30616]|uniref:Uncharacterized protein n=1 Tax=Coniochaeta ligniaria NRRL 30616 TaxID=1408157 RepID=A0A1J7JF53_9PEZI|nr:hypothetical protein CONLIGDRAFT_652827 [Coniochaeta ligniaria NRRL 30616]